MLIRRMISVSVLLLLAACGSKSNHDPAPNSQPDSRSDDAIKSYSEEANLTLLKTHEQLSTANDNSVHISGRGEKSNYQISYKFNSGSNVSFSVLQTSLDANFSGCKTPETTMQLLGKAGVQNVDLDHAVKLEPNTDYVLQVNINQSCKDLEALFEVRAWAGVAAEEARIATVCDGKDKKQMTFFRNDGLVTAFSEPGKKFLSNDRFCGVPVPAANSKCSSTADVSSATCEAQVGANSASSTVTFDEEHKSASVTCSANKKAIFSSPFTNCTTGVLNYKQFEK